MSPSPAVVACEALWQGLAEGGMRQVVVSPGARSAPLVWALDGLGGALEAAVHTDERLAAFVALGAARATGRPVGLVCTSGSALLHMAPALAEAWASRVPLVVLSADRPPELHHCDAPQTMPQVGLMGPLLRGEFAPEVPDATSPPRWQRLGLRAALLALGTPAGPVHLNLAFREPLGREDTSAPAPAPGRTGVGGVLILGEGADDGAEPGSWAGLADEALAKGWIVMADVLSPARGGGDARVIRGADLLLRGEAPAAVDQVVRVGRAPVSKALQTWVRGAVRAGASFTVVDPARRWSEPLGLDARFVETWAPHGVDPAAQQAWIAAERWLKAWLADAVEAGSLPLEWLGSALALQAAPRHLHVASSMPIRWVDMLGPLHPTGTVLTSNRGLNGIDGTFATAAGWAWGGAPLPMTVLVGDVATLHDLTGLAALPRQGVRVVVLHNDGGGIFGLLPLNDGSAGFERFFGTPHGQGFAHAAAHAGLGYRCVDHPAALQAALQAREMGADAPSELLEVRIDRHAHLAHHRATVARLQADLAAAAALGWTP
jgi:2-succinyl-5-enolpyruvyl-6-hydroxy-3-cyclohexene-1-carboxylate synthase